MYSATKDPHWLLPIMATFFLWGDFLTQNSIGPNPLMSGTSSTWPVKPIYPSFRSYKRILSVVNVRYTPTNANESLKWLNLPVNLPPVECKAVPQLWSDLPPISLHRLLGDHFSLQFEYLHLLRPNQLLTHEALIKQWLMLHAISPEAASILFHHSASWPNTRSSNM